MALVRRFVELKPDTEGVLGECLSELIQNILDHAHSPCGGLLTARALRGRQGSVRIAVADSGVGIRGSLRQR